ncbi:MAG: TraB/GumN family protein, partial [Croceimicrobium sp.]
MKPMVLSTSYSVALAEKLTPDSLIYGGLPMDMYFARNAKLEGKELIKLETMKEQFEILFGSQTIEEQLADLLDIVKEDQKGSDVMMGILNAYFDNDLDGLYASSMDFDGESESMEVMIDDRNKNWIVSLEEPLQEGGLFIAVGALHLPGEKGLIKLLQAKGFKFTALN